MAKKLDPQLLEILTTYGERPEDALWDCHGTWVAYHKAIERIAAKAGVKYSNPTVLVAEREAAAILVTGELGERTEWSIGEAVINLNYRVSGKQAAYPFAMAEKRAKDRVVLKLIGLHGLVYSEEESDDFKPAQPAVRSVERPTLVVEDDRLPDPPRKENGLPERGWRDDGSRTSYALKKEQPELWQEFDRELGECQTLVMLEKFKNEWREKIVKERWNKQFKDAAKDRIDYRASEIVDEMERLSLASPDELADLPVRTALEHSIANHPLNAG